METDFGALTPMQKKAWSVLSWKAGRDESFWLREGNGFLSKGVDDGSRPIHFVNELTKTESGDKCIMHLVPDLQDDGTAGDNTLEGNEEALGLDYVEITIDQFRHAVKSKGRMSEQRTVVRFRAQAKNKLSFWWAARLDEMLFLTAAGIAFTSTVDGASRSATSQIPSLKFAAGVTAPSTNRKKFGGTATATNNITTADKMTWDFLVTARAFAVRKRLNPVRVNGKDTYIIVMSAEQARDLKLDPAYKTALANAGVKGQKNELFTGAFADVDGLVLYEHNRVPNTLQATSGSKYGSGGTIDGAQALLLGAQALGFARIGDPRWDESDNTDYSNKQGIAYSGMIGMLKPVFKSVYDSNAEEDFGVMSLYTAAAA